MADKHSSTQNGSATQHFGSSISQTATGIYSYAHRSLDRVVPPSSRQDLYERIYAFAKASPILFVSGHSQAQSQSRAAAAPALYQNEQAPLTSP